ncbi:MAG: 6-bladed beta-propeller [Acidobacteriota bacterium]
MKGEPIALELEEELVIDTEKQDIAGRGLGDVRKFDVDSQGNIYLFQMPREGAHLVFKFNPAGGFVKSFGKVGQGPGEIQFPFYQRINRRDEIIIWDSGALKYVAFDAQGTIIRETRLELKMYPLGGPLFLENGGFLTRETGTSEGARAYDVSVSLYDAGFKKLRELCKYQLLDPQEADKINAYPDFPVIGISATRIYVGKIAAGYEISGYDLDGNLVRKMRKKYQPVRVQESLKTEIFAELGNHPFRNKFYFPEEMPAFQFFFVDDEERLYVATSEKSADGQNICDILNRDGIFIARKALGFYDLLRAVWQGRELDIIAKRGRLYCLREKDSGYKELAVFRMSWVD